MIYGTPVKLTDQNSLLFTRKVSTKIIETAGIFKVLILYTPYVDRNQKPSHSAMF